MEHSTLVGHSILVFEADSRLAGYLRGTLEGAGACVAHASSGAEALRIIAADELSGAVLDFGLGIEGGQAVARRLRELELPFVFWSRGELGGLARWPGVPVLSKPGNRVEIVEMLRRLLQPEIATTGDAQAGRASRRVRQT